MSEGEPKINPESVAEVRERIAIRLEAMVSEIGFAASEDMNGLAQRMDAGNIGALLSEWQILGLAIVEGIPAGADHLDEVLAARFGLMLEQARVILKSGGPINEVAIIIDEASRYAYKHYDHLIDELDAMVEQLDAI